MANDRLDFENPDSQQSFTLSMKRSLYVAISDMARTTGKSWAETWRIGMTQITGEYEAARQKEAKKKEKEKDGV